MTLRDDVAATVDAILARFADARAPEAPHAIDVMVWLEPMAPDDPEQWWEDREWSRLMEGLRGAGYLEASHDRFGGQDVVVARFLARPVEVACVTIFKGDAFVERCQAVLWEAGIPFGEALSMGSYYFVPERLASTARALLRRHPDLARFVIGDP